VEQLKVGAAIARVNWCWDGITKKKTIIVKVKQLGGGAIVVGVEN